LDTQRLTKINQTWWSAYHQARVARSCYGDRAQARARAKRKRGKVKTEEAKKLSIEAIVMWDNDPDDLGIVTEIGPNGFYVIWRNGADQGWIDFRDAQKISLIKQGKKERKSKMWQHTYLWQIRVKDNEGNIHSLGVPMLRIEATYWLRRIRALGEWCQLKRIEK
jgi:hypothetical protein